jgi:hypothetical protein
MAEIVICADGGKNSQVTPQVKEFLYEWLQENGVTDARESIVLHHYRNGEFVAVSNFGTVKTQRFSKLQKELANAHPEHRITSDDCVWISRAWLSNQI